ncbi:unnamed protein product, partial [Staurois parvus]
QGSEQGVSRAVDRVSSLYGSLQRPLKCKAVNRGLLGGVKSQQGSIQGSAEPRIRASRAEDRGHCWQGTEHSSFSHPCTVHSLGTGIRSPPPHTAHS